MTASKEKLSIYHIQKTKTGYGHWKVTLLIDNRDEFLIVHGRQIKGERTVNISCITTDSIAIDGHHGGDQTLAKQCLCENGFDEEEYDLSSLDSGDDE